MEETSERSVLGRHQSCSEERIEVLSDSIELPAYCIPKVVRMETGEVMYEKVCVSPRPPPKISLKHDWKRELGSEDAQRPEGQVVQQFKSFQSNQPIPNPDHDRTEQPVVRTERTGQPVVETRRTQTRSSDGSKSLNVEIAHDRTGNPLLKHTQIMCQMVPKHVLFMKA